MNDANFAMVLIIRQGFLRRGNIFRVLAQKMRFVTKAI
ncbi:hypothetical protein KsCSTR_00060 [Candidatus Kuenenia stuttgartiensis]|uniref:Uncharacterized protein n=1 Tax=Kuenenia stuttgartiensis TaxID=174633 RepID=A0A6G7GIQ0_KUEST|nr:hypothetical protein KsCSTR_00060 [Candidatus Kuenenia stuttgartiensis]